MPRKQLRCQTLPKTFQAVKLPFITHVRPGDTVWIVSFEVITVFPSLNLFICIQIQNYYSEFRDRVKEVSVENTILQGLMLICGELFIHF